MVDYMLPPNSVSDIENYTDFQNKEDEESSYE